MACGSENSRVSSASAPGPSGTTTASACCPSPRKANGYREYSLRDAVELARVRRLTKLGLSLDVLVGRMAHVAAGRPGPESAMAVKDRDLLALLETASPARGTGWLDVLTRTLNSDPQAVERAYGVYVRLDELAGAPADDPRIETTAQAIVAAIPESTRQAIRFPDGDLEETSKGFAAAFYADFAPAQAAAIRRVVGLLREARAPQGCAARPEAARHEDEKETTA